MGENPIKTKREEDVVLPKVVDEWTPKDKEGKK